MVQDISISVLNSLGSLKKPERFWSWVFSIATNKIRERFRRELARKTVSISELEIGRAQRLNSSHRL